MNIVNVWGLGASGVHFGPIVIMEAAIWSSTMLDNPGLLISAAEWLNCQCHDVLALMMLVEVTYP